MHGRETQSKFLVMIFYIPCIYMTDMTSLTFFSSLPFIFELLGFFMVMVGIAKIKVIDATESCLLSIFSVGNFFAN